MLEFWYPSQLLKTLTSIQQMGSRISMKMVTKRGLVYDHGKFIKTEQIRSFAQYVWIYF